MNYSTDQLIDMGIEKLKTFGFVYANKNNFFKDDVYIYHFKKFMSVMLEKNEEWDMAINELFSSIDKQDK